VYQLSGKLEHGLNTQQPGALVVWKEQHAEAHSETPRTLTRFAQLTLPRAAGDARPARWRASPHPPLHSRVHAALGGAAGRGSRAPPRFCQNAASRWRALDMCGCLAAQSLRARAAPPAARQDRFRAAWSTSQSAPGRPQCAPLRTRAQRPGRGEARALRAAQDGPCCCAGRHRPAARGTGALRARLRRCAHRAPCVIACLALPAGAPRAPCSVRQRPERWRAARPRRSPEPRIAPGQRLRPVRAATRAAALSTAGHMLRAAWCECAQ